MVRIAKGGWIARAEDLLARTDGMSAQDRRNFLRNEVRTNGGSVQTAHRQMVALQWVQRRAPLYGVPLKEVVVAYNGVEALMKLETVSPKQAAMIIKAALRGDMTSRDVIGLTERATRGDPPVDWPDEDEIFLRDYIGMMMPYGEANIAAVVTELSEWGKILRVDIEWRMKDGRTIAVFLSPKMRAAQNSTMSDVFPRAVAARCLYHGVAFFSFDDDENDLLSRFEDDETGAFFPPFIFHARTHGLSDEEVKEAASPRSKKRRSS